MRSPFLSLLIASVVWQMGFAQTKPAPAKPADIPRFVDISKSSGLTVSHISSPEAKYIIDSVSGGVGFIDCDNSGKLSIITVNGSTVDRYLKGGDPMITLYHQEPGLKFKDITSRPALPAKAGEWASRSPTSTTMDGRIFTSRDTAARSCIATRATASLRT